VTVSLLQACDDPALFGVEPWPRQREILAQIDSGDYREIVLALGRRSGKNLMAALVGLHDVALSTSRCEDGLSASDKREKAIE
jgi:hypothetical protein